MQLRQQPRRRVRPGLRPFWTSSRSAALAATVQAAALGNASADQLATSLRSCTFSAARDAACLPAAHCLRARFCLPYAPARPRLPGNSRVCRGLSAVKIMPCPLPGAARPTDRDDLRALQGAAIERGSGGSPGGSSRGGQLRRRQRRRAGGAACCHVCGAHRVQHNEPPHRHTFSKSTPYMTV